MFEFMYDLLVRFGWNMETSYYLAYLVIFVIVGILSFLANLIAKLIIVRILNHVLLKSRFKWRDIVFKQRVFHRLSHFIPALIIYAFSNAFKELEVYIIIIADIYMLIIGIWMISTILNVILIVYESFEIAQRRPIRGYIQLIKIMLFVVFGILILAELVGFNPWNIITGIGAASALLLLVFRDSIMGLLASIQLSAYNMVQIGDWVQLPKYNADGTVIEISLNTIKVQNWDKTIVSLPTPVLITDSFINFRGMQETGARRISRSIYFRYNSLKPVSDEVINQVRKLDAIKKPLSEIETPPNPTIQADQTFMELDAFLQTQPNCTNFALFRYYVLTYLVHHPKIRNDLTMIVRFLDPTSKGIPLQIYAFSTETAWVDFEAVQFDIFNHIFAILPIFELIMFEKPSGTVFSIQNEPKVTNNPTQNNSTYITTDTKAERTKKDN